MPPLLTLFRSIANGLSCDTGFTMNYSIRPSCGVSIPSFTIHRASKPSKQLYARARLTLSRRNPFCLTSVSYHFVPIISHSHRVLSFEPVGWLYATLYHPLFASFASGLIFPPVRCRKLTILPHSNPVPSTSPPDTCVYPSNRNARSLVTSVTASWNRLDFGARRVATLYELRASYGMELKKDLLIQVAQLSGDGLRTTCLKMPTN